MDRVLLVTPYYYPEGTAASHRITMFSEVLAKYYDVDVIVYNNKEKPFNPWVENIRVYFWKDFFNIKEPYRFPLDMIRLFYLVLFNRYKWILVSTPEAMPSLGTAFLLRPFFRVIIDFRDTVLERISHITPGTMKYYYTKITLLIEKFLFKKHNVTLLINTQGMAEFMKKKYGIERKVYILPNGVDRRMIREGTFTKKRKKYDFVYIGLLGIYRMPQEMFKIISILKDKYKNFKALLIIGDKNLYRERGFDLDKFIKDYNVEENVEIMPFLSWTQLPEVLSLCKVGYMPILDDKAFHFTVGSKIYDYISAELPVVCYANPEKHRELYRVLGDAGLYGSSSEEVAELIFKLITDKRFYEKHKNMLSKIKFKHMFDEKAKKFIEEVMLVPR